MRAIKAHIQKVKKYSTYTNVFISDYVDDNNITDITTSEHT